MRNLRTGNVFDKTFKAPDRIVEPQVELRPVQFLYADGDGYHFMDGNQLRAVRADGRRPRRRRRLPEGRARRHPLGGVQRAASSASSCRRRIVLRVEQTDPAIKGATAQAQTKPATLETGLVIQVPAYLESGELVQVDTREARFVSRAKE